MVSCLDRLPLFSLCVCVCGGALQNPSKSFILNYECRVVDITEAAASLPITTSGGTDHGLPHGFPWLHGPWTATWSLVASQTMNLIMTSSGNLDYGHPHGFFWWQHGPWKSTLPLIAPWKIDSTWSPVAVWNTNLIMASDSFMDLRNQHSPQLQHVHICPPVASETTDIYMVSSGSTDNRHQST